MKQIKVGVNAEFPDSEQKAHNIVMEMVEHPPENIAYSWARPKTLNNRGIFFHPKTKEFDLIDSGSSNLMLTNNRWISKMVTIEFGLDMIFKGTYFPRSKRIEILRKIYKKENTKKIVFYCKAGYDSLKEYAGITDKDIIDKSTVLYNSIPQVDNPVERSLKKAQENSDYKEKNKFRILFIGTAFHLKGGASLIDAFEILQKKYPFIELELHSSLLRKGYLDTEVFQPLHHEKTVKQVLSNKSILNHTSFEVPRKTILEEVYPRADMFILPSMQEGLPYVLQEAMSYGLPIVTTNCVPSMPEIVKDQENCLMIDVQNQIFEKVHNTRNNKGQKIITEHSKDYLTKEIVEKVSKLIESKNLRDQMRKNNLKRSKKLFSFKKNNKRLREIYEEATD